MLSEFAESLVPVIQEEYSQSTEDKYFVQRIKSNLALKLCDTIYWGYKLNYLWDPFFKIVGSFCGPRHFEMSDRRVHSTSYYIFLKQKLTRSDYVPINEEDDQTASWCQAK